MHNSAEELAFNLNPSPAGSGAHNSAEELAFNLNPSPAGREGCATARMRVTRLRNSQ